MPRGGLAAAALIATLAACRPHPAAPRAATPSPGIAIALYRRGDRGFAVVDDRRWVEVTPAGLELARVDPGASLASLLIEPVDHPADHPGLRIGTCTRGRFAAPRTAPGTNKKGDVVHCAASGARGRILVRVLYVTRALGYAVRHDVAMTAPDRATLATRFSIATPAWHERARVTLYDGVPGEQAPRRIAGGELALDGSTAVLAPPPRVVPAHLRRVFDGAVLRPDVPPTDPMWGHDSTNLVWVWLELAEPHLVRGDVRVHLELPDEGSHDVTVAADRRTGTRVARLPLWIDDTLRGARERFNDFGEGAALAERLVVSVSNTGAVAREVWIEEPLRPARGRRIEHAWPVRPAAAGDLLREPVVVRPGATERAGFTVAYDF